MTERQHTFTWEDPADFLSRAATLSGLDVWRAIAAGELPPPPIGSAFACTVSDVREGHIAFSMTPEDWMLNPLGTIHGGAIATLLDSVLGCCVHTTLPAGTSYTTIDLNVTYLRAVTPAMGELRAEGDVVHAGRRLATSSARLTTADGETLLATGTSSCMILAPR